MGTRVVALLFLLVVAGCGSESKDSDPPDAEPTPVYFASSDTDAVNVAAAEVEERAGAALLPKALKRCNRAGEEPGYGPWRACWHNLLDPLEAAFLGMGETHTDLIRDDMPEACQTLLATAAEEAEGYAGEIAALAALIDSDDRPDQNKAMDEYQEIITDTVLAFRGTFSPLTNACYSPEELAEIEASQSASTE